VRCVFVSKPKQKKSTGNFLFIFIGSRREAVAVIRKRELVLLANIPEPDARIIGRKII